jgi:hypothetical protein
MKEKSDIQMLKPDILQALFQPKTFNEKDNTMDFVFSTGARVKRHGYFMELGMEKRHVRMKRLKNGAPFLKNHGDHGLCGGSPRLEDVLGVIEGASVDGKTGIGKVRFTHREDVQPIIGDIKSGILPNISVGFIIHKAKKVEEIIEKDEDGDEFKTPVYRAVDWEPIECSSVPAGADDDAMTRSILTDSVQTYPCEFVRDKEIKIPVVSVDKSTGAKNQVEVKLSKKGVEIQPAITQTQNIGAKKMPENEKTKIVEDAKKEGVKAEKQRQKEISDAVRAAGLENDVAEDLINRDVTVDAARTEIIKKLAEKNAEKQTRSQTVEAGQQDEVETRRVGMQEALLHRGNPEIYKLTDRAKPFAFRSLLRLGEECLRARGISVDGLSRNEIATRSLHSTSDFPFILANVASKTLRDEYERAPRTFEPFVRETTTPDFKQIQRTQLSGAPALEKINEHGEVKGGKMSEAAEVYSLDSYGKRLGFTRKTIVNDDMEALTRVPASMGLAARDLENDLVYNHLLANGLMGDGNALFSAAHSNFVGSGSGAAPSETTLTAARAAMRKQTGLAGQLLNLWPIWLLVPAALETTAEKLVTAIQSNEVSKVNPFAPGGRTPLQIIVEPRLDASSATAWYAIAMKTRIDLFELVRLEGTSGPIVSTRQGWEIEGVEMKVIHDAAVKAIDWRGMYFNYGA